MTIETKRNRFGGGAVFLNPLCLTFPPPSLSFPMRNSIEMPTQTKWKLQNANVILFWQAVSSRSRSRSPREVEEIIYKIVFWSCEFRNGIQLEQRRAFCFPDSLVRWLVGLLCCIIEWVCLAERKTGRRRGRRNGSTGCDVRRRRWWWTDEEKWKLFRWLLQCGRLVDRVLN